MMWETAILERLDNPLAFEPYPSIKKRKFPYYRIYVRNYVIYYVVIGEVMEVRRFLYGARDTGQVSVKCSETMCYVWSSECETQNDLILICWQQANN